MTTESAKAFIVGCLLAIECVFASGIERYTAELESAHDGDTITVWALVQPDLKRRYKIRVIGVDTPEIRAAKCSNERDMAYEARDFVINALIARDFEIELTGKMTFDRWLARVYVDGDNLAGIIIASELGIANHGERRRSWCE